MLLGGCGTGEPTSESGGSVCPDELVWDGRVYTVTRADRPLTKGDSLGRAMFTDCDDGGGTVAEDQDGVAVWSLDGLATRDGFAAEKGDQLFLYIVTAKAGDCSLLCVGC